MARGQPFCDHLDIPERGIFIVVLVDIGGDGSGAFFVLTGANQGKFLLLSFSDEFGDDVEHSIVPFYIL